MKDIKNSIGKLVCRIDESARYVEIIHKGCKTSVSFRSDGTAEIINTNKSRKLPAIKI